jgi:hypothetical protein
MRPVVPLVLVLLPLLFAGCAESAGVKDLSASQTLTAQAQGGIAGIVTDTEALPLVGARVQVLRVADAKAMETFTDAAGRFLLTALEPGPHQVFASFVGYHESNPKTVDVVAGETLQAAIVLDALRVQKAFVETKPYTFYFTLNWCLPDPYDQVSGGYNCQALGWDGTTIRMPFTVDEAANGTLMGIVHEMDWKTGTTACSGGMVADVYSPQQKPLPPEGQHKHPARSASNPYHWANPTVKSPTRTFIPRDGPDVVAMHSAQRTELNKGAPIQTTGDWGIVHWSTYAEGPSGAPLPVGCMVDQKLNGWISIFYVEAPPAEFSVYKKT